VITRGCSKVALFLGQRQVRKLSRTPLIDKTRSLNPTSQRVAANHRHSVYLDKHPRHCCVCLSLSTHENHVAKMPTTDGSLYLPLSITLLVALTAVWYLHGTSCRVSSRGAVVGIANPLSTHHISRQQDSTGDTHGSITSVRERRRHHGWCLESAR
jgi:hypothetical protein